MGIRIVKNNQEPKPIFGILLPIFVFELFDISFDKKKAKHFLKHYFNINQKRVIDLNEAQVGNESYTTLIVYDKIVEENQEIKYANISEKLTAYDFPMIHMLNLFQNDAEAFIKIINEID